MLWSQFSAIFDNFRRKNWRFSLKPMLWSKFCIIYLCFVSKMPKNHNIGPWSPDGDIHRPQRLLTHPRVAKIQVGFTSIIRLNVFNYILQYICIQSSYFTYFSTYVPMHCTYFAHFSTYVCMHSSYFTYFSTYLYVCCKVNFIMSWGQFLISPQEAKFDPQG
jgi:hypothetical protein